MGTCSWGCLGMLGKASKRNWTSSLKLFPQAMIGYSCHWLCCQNYCLVAMQTSYRHAIICSTCFTNAELALQRTFHCVTNSPPSTITECLLVDKIIYDFLNVSICVLKIETAKNYKLYNLVITTAHMDYYYY